MFDYVKISLFSIFFLIAFGVVAVAQTSEDYTLPSDIETSLQEGTETQGEEAFIKIPVEQVETLEVVEESPEIYLDLNEIVEENPNFSEIDLEEYEYIPLEEIEKELEDLQDYPNPQNSGNDFDQQIQEENAESANHNGEESKGPRAISASGDVEKFNSEVNYVFYKGNKKEMETTAKEGSLVNIQKEESVEESSVFWKKNVKIYSEEHFENAITTYTDIFETSSENIEIYWKEEDKYLSFDKIDEDGNGFADRVSWVVPHLSEQNFEIYVYFEQDNNSEILNLTTLESPKDITDENTRLEFGFNISYVDIDNVRCNFTLSNNDEIIYQKDDLLNITTNEMLENGDYDWLAFCYDINNFSMNDFEQGSFKININYTPVINFAVNNNSIRKNDGVVFTLNISAKINSSIFYLFDFGDGSSPQWEQRINVTYLLLEIPHTYTSTGNFNSKLNVTIEGIPYSFYQTISVSETGDDDAPEVRLIRPENNAILTLPNRNEITIFSFNVTDNVKIENCTFNIYYYNDSNFGESVYTELKTPSSGDNVSIELVDFDQGDYSWEVECYDNSSNYDSASRDFEIRYSDSQGREQRIEMLDNETIEQIEEVDLLLNTINEFLIKEAQYGQEEREALQDLGLVENLQLYKKRLTQMKIDLEHNVDYIRDENRREEREADILKEIEDMKQNVPVDFSVIESHEYYKNSLDIDIAEIIQMYADAKGLELSGNVFDELLKRNELIQNGGRGQVDARHIEIEYLERDEEITLVTKEFEFENSSFDKFIEIIPKEVAASAGEVIFVNKYEIIEEDPVFAINVEDLQQNKFIYYIRDIIELEKIEKTTTILFIEDIPAEELNKITGFVFLLGEGYTDSFWFYFSWVFVLVLIFSSARVVVRKVKISRVKKEDSGRRLLSLISEVKEAIKDKDIELARAKYEKAKGAYADVSKESKKVIYARFKKLIVQIQRLEGNVLIKEFISLAKEGKKEEALALYEKIKEIYPRLSKSQKNKVYQVIKPHLKLLKK